MAGSAAAAAAEDAGLASARAKQPAPSRLAAAAAARGELVERAAPARRRGGGEGARDERTGRVRRREGKQARAAAVDPAIIALRWKTKKKGAGKFSSSAASGTVQMLFFLLFSFFCYFVFVHR